MCFFGMDKKNWKLGYVIDELGNETTMHLFQEKDMVCHIFELLTIIIKFKSQ